MRARIDGNMALWGCLLGALGGIFDIVAFVSLGFDFQVAGRDATWLIGAFLSVNFAVLGGAIGWFIDARAREQRDAQTIRDEMQALDASRRAAAQNEKLAAIGRLAAGIAHEVRNPLGVIRASASMVQESFDPESEPWRACGFICEEIDRLNGLIVALLGFARPTAPRLGSVGLEKLLDRALAIQSQELTRRRIDVVRNASPHLPEIQGDPDLLAQLVVGLLSNAAEALGNGGRIELRTEALPDAVVLEVADSGIGISLEDAERIFEPFFTTKATGTGLGLAMTARIVEAHGGTVEIVQGRGAGDGASGACFRICLPVEGPLGSTA